MSRIIPKQKRGVATKAAIMRAAHEVIRQKGRDYFTTGDVAKAAGVSVGSYYRHWANRAELLVELYPNMIDGLGDPSYPVEEVEQ